MTKREEEHSSVGVSNHESCVQSYTCLRMLRPRIARGVVEDGVIAVYHCMDNSRCCAYVVDNVNVY